MNSIWLKIAGLAVVAVLIIVILGRMGGNESASEPAQKDKTFSEMVDRDKQFTEAPKPVEESDVSTVGQPEDQPQPPPEQPPEETAAPAQQPVAQAPGVVLPSSITQRTTLHFVPLEEEDDIQAQNLLPWAAAGRSLGRLPMLTYGTMVKACRQIMERWPDSWYAFRARQMLEEVTIYTNNYNITPQELDISRFLKPRRGSQPRQVEPVR